MYINNYGELVNNDELYHHGVQGMHLGIRRYQPYSSGHSGDGKFIGKESHSNKRAGKEGNSDKHAEKEKKWRKEQTAKVHTRYDDLTQAFKEERDRRKSILDKAVAKGASKRSIRRKERKYNQIDSQYKEIVSKRNEELKAVKNMKYSDIRGERLAIGKNYAKRGIGLIGRTAILNALGLPSPVTSSFVRKINPTRAVYEYRRDFNAKNAKSNNRR